MLYIMIDVYNIKILIIGVLRWHIDYLKKFSDINRQDE